MRLLFSLLLVVLSLSASNCKKSKSKNQAPPSNAEIDIKVLTSDLTNPWELVWGKDNFIWMTERGGKISRVDPATGKAVAIVTINEVVSRGEGGLLGMALHPDFDKTPEVFVVYNYTKSGAYLEKVVKYSYNGTVLVNPVILLDNIPANTFHNGCRLLISPDLKLYISTGDAGNQPSAQDINSVSGKILRINLDGSIPADNPFPGNPVWSFGHRNAQGLVFVNDKLYSSEHGPDSDDEINLIEKKQNFGWPDVKGFCNENSEKAFCQANTVVEPLYAWTPTIAVCGLDYYNNEQIPQWKNSLILATLKDNTLYQLKLNDSGSKIEELREIIRGTYGRLRDVCVAPDGKVYVSTSNGSNDKIIVISKKPV
jgi:aldose sugar dehydrogenase